MSKPVWYCQKVGIAGDIAIRADLELSTGTLGYARYIHPFQVDEQPETLAEAIREMTEVMGRMKALSLPESRACAFGGRHEEPACA